MRSTSTEDNLEPFHEQQSTKALIRRRNRMHRKVEMCLNEVDFTINV